MTEKFDEIKAMYDRINKAMDANELTHNTLTGVFVDATQHKEISHDLKLKGGSGAKAEPKMGDMLDGAEGKKIERDLKSKDGAGSVGDIPEMKAPVANGATGEKIKKL